MSEEALIIEKQGPIATVTLNRPDAMNSFDRSLKDAMLLNVAKLNDDPDLRVVISEGHWKMFFGRRRPISGGIAEPISFHLDTDYKPFLTGIEHSDKIWIAQVHGAAAGIGAAIAMNCDLVVMSDDAYIYMAFAAIGLVPDGGNTQLLLKYLGYHRALETILEGKKMPADECLAAGIANKVVSMDELENTTMQWAEKLVSTAPLALAACKRVLRRVGSASFGDAITIEGLEQTHLIKSDDFKEGVAAFFEKRKPNWQGK